MIRLRDFKIERARSVRLICNHEHDFGPKLHDTNFNYHFITSILKSISSLQISFISPHGIAGLWTSVTGNVYTCNVICKTEWHVSFRTQTHSRVPWVPEDIFFLIDTDGSRRSRVNEAHFFFFFFVNAASVSVRKKYPPEPRLIRG